MSSGEFQWLLFDLDNTLLDFSASSRKSFEKLVFELEIPGQPAELYREYSQINHRLWKKREEGGIGHEELKLKRWELFFEQQNLSFDPTHANERYFQGITENVEFVLYANELLELLQKRYRMMIITNGLSEVQRPRIEISGIGQYFEDIIISDEIGSAKPQHEYFRECHSRMHAPDPKKVLVIGDTLKSDIKGARDFGYRSCWFNHDYLAPDGSNLPNYEINKLEELNKILGLPFRM
jgi:YjjG family noncanonical pyrimidine nucleotidase